MAASDSRALQRYWRRFGTNGWDSGVRRSVCKKFNMPFEEIESRHNLMFDSYERGFMKFEDYRGYVFFDKPRDFTIESVRDFTYDLQCLGRTTSISSPR